MPSQSEEAFYILGIATGCIIVGVFPYIIMFFSSVDPFYVIATTPIYVIGLGLLLLIIGYFYKE